MFNWLYNLLGTMLSFFDSITGSYALALLFYALIFKIVFLPFSIKQQKNQIKMAELTPKIALIRAKYKGRTDQRTMQKQQQEIMELQQREGYSPMSGCLPLLIQLPLIMLLYTVIQNPLSYIASPNAAIDNYNSSPDSAIIENLPEELESIYNERKEKGEELTQNDLVLALYRRFYPETLGDEPYSGDYINEEDYKKALDEYNKNLKAITTASELPKGTEIKLIGIVNNFINGENSNRFPDADSRKEYVSSFGLDYSTYPSFDLFGANMADTPSFKTPSLILVIPFLTAIIQWLTMFITRKLNGNANPMQAQDAQAKSSMVIMDLIFPAMTLWMAFSFSAMLGLYWTFQSILGLGQSFILAKAMPLPKFTDEDLKELRRLEKEAEKAGRAMAKSDTKHRSLHYIDEDDYDDLPVIDKKNDNNGNTRFSSDVPEIKD
jgi:YidC/Oxa1 family membrane protein insertase